MDTYHSRVYECVSTIYFRCVNIHFHFHDYHFIHITISTLLLFLYFNSDYCSHIVKGVNIGNFLDNREWRYKKARGPTKQRENACHCLSPTHSRLVYAATNRADSPTRNVCIHCSQMGKWWRLKNPTSASRQQPRAFGSWGGVKEFFFTSDFKSFASYHVQWAGFWSLSSLNEFGAVIVRRSTKSLQIEIFYLWKLLVTELQPRVPVS